MRPAVWSNCRQDFGLHKGLENLDAVRHKLAEVSARFAAFEAQSLHTPIDFPLFQRLAHRLWPQPGSRYQDPTTAA